jgi:hypothetical protein
LKKLLAPLLSLTSALMQGQEAEFVNCIHISLTFYNILIFT